MRALKFLSLIFITSLFGCNDGDDPSPNPSIGGTMSATIDGTITWAATSAYYNQPAANAIQFSGERNASGTDATAIGIQMTTFSGLNIYSIDTMVNKAFIFRNNTYYIASSGQIEVTQSDATWFKANFNFTATDTLHTGTKIVSGNFTYRKK